MPTHINARLLKIVCLCLLGTQLQAVEVTIHKNDASGLLTWTSKDNGFIGMALYNYC